MPQEPSSRRPTPILNKIPGPMDARFLSSVGLSLAPAWGEHNSSQHPQWIKIGFPNFSPFRTVGVAHPESTARHLDASRQKIDSPLSRGNF